MMDSTDAKRPETTVLVVIDMQRIFQDPNSQWYVSNYPAVENSVAQLRSLYGEQVIWTRFVRDPEEKGAWADYYQRWDNCREAPDSEYWDISMGLDPSDQVLTLPTFSKWGPELAALTAEHEHLVVAGVATDCCVLATVLGAVDAGKRVTVIADACGGATPEAHQQALALLQLLAPMVTVTTLQGLK